MARYAATTDGRGEYHLLGLPTGQYVLTVEQPGFRTTVNPAWSCAWRIGRRSTSPSKWAARAITECHGAAPLLQTQSGEVSLNVGEKRISTLPLDGGTLFLW